MPSSINTCLTNKQKKWQSLLVYMFAILDSKLYIPKYHRLMGRGGMSIRKGGAPALKGWVTLVYNTVVLSLSKIQNLPCIFIRASTK